MAFGFTCACGARSELTHLASRAQQDPKPVEHDGGTIPSPSTTLFVETEAPVLLFPQPCGSRDAAQAQPASSAPSMTPTLPSVSKGQCGNSRHEEYESCDDGNLESGDGCDATCRIEPYYVCATGGQRCVRLEVCGDGVTSNTEACDDGNLNPGDGCSPSCQLEVKCTPGGDCWSCTRADEPCTRSEQPGHCGDGAVQAAQGELCDTGHANISEYGGCTESCSLAARCGDLLVQTCGQETCDDGNRVGGDGCSADCKLEQRWVR